MIADGKYAASLFDADFCVTNAGTPAISFVWETDGGERTSYLLALTDSTGRPNHFGIQLTRRWATAWNGSDLTWFRVNREALLGTRANLTVRDGKIEWVTPADAASLPSGCISAKCTPCAVHGTAPTGEEAPMAGLHNENGNLLSTPNTYTSADGTAPRRIHINLVVDPAKLAEMPERIEPTFKEAKALFDLVTEGTEKLDADMVWTIMAKKIGPMQVDFGEEEWSMMIERIKRLKSWSGCVAV